MIGTIVIDRGNFRRVVERNRNADESRYLARRIKERIGLLPMAKGK